jgi:hypothetical protein
MGGATVSVIVQGTWISIAAIAILPSRHYA